MNYKREKIHTTRTLKGTAKKGGNERKGKKEKPPKFTTSPQD